MLPAYVPNPVAAATGGGSPIDSGRNFSDGKRIFGDGKTIRGFFAGVGAGILVGLLQIGIRDIAGLSQLPELTIFTVFLLASGALVGDLIKSFFKRRLGKKRGERWPVADQYDLVAGAFLFLILFDYQWVVSTVTPLIFLWILILTYLLHRTVNIIGFKLKVKDVPW
ncbi:MAG TPA: CDP-2,3-bis-(O-geranylgeranyl)-sn-glycerol synthase [Methanoregulaceae archaeon]|nr:CDP-2,3-bis-(O-geranylgeranyl)-sn-glycerol synthase [Methanoregulaceae archaeon]